MANLAGILKQEISRIARKEGRRIAGSIREDLVKLKKRELELRRNVADLKAQFEAYSAKGTYEKLQLKATSGEIQGRLSPRLIRTLRNRMKISQSQFGKLVGVSITTVVNWETGKVTPRDDARQRILSLRGLKRRAVKRLIEEL